VTCFRLKSIIFRFCTKSVCGHSSIEEMVFFSFSPEKTYETLNTRWGQKAEFFVSLR
jgi:hypothetical protein